MSLASERGFDGYLLNFEVQLPERSSDATLLEAWINRLETELRVAIGLHAQVVW